jgi:hypothetical protein
MARKNAFAPRPEPPMTLAALFTFRIVNIALQKTEKRSINFPRQQGHIKREHDWACQPSSYPQVPYQFLTPAQVAQGMLCITVDTLLVY